MTLWQNPPLLMSSLRSIVICQKYFKITVISSKIHIVAPLLAMRRCTLCEGFDSSVIMPFPGVLWLWHFLYSVGPHPVLSLNIYTFVVSWAFMAGAASQAGDADSSRAPGLTPGLQGSVNVHRGALLLVTVHQLFCILQLCHEYLYSQF